MQYIRDQLESMPLVVPLISQAYLDSEFCQWELGAAWVRRVDMVPIIVDPVRPGELRGPLQNRQVAGLDRAGLNNLALRIAACFNLQTNWTRWEQERDKLIADLPGILIRLRSKWDTTASAVLRRKAAVGEQSQHLHEVMHRLRDAAALKVLHGSTDRSMFLTLLRYAVDEIVRCFSSMTGRACRVAVKQVLALPGGVPAVVDLSRSPTGRLHRTPELISDNTDFEELMHGTSRYFLCNDIAALRAAGNYKNSHAVAGQPLPYNSALVWPVQKVYEDQPPEGISDWQSIVAYLCVDSSCCGVPRPVPGSVRY